MKLPALPAFKANISVKLIGFMLAVSVLPLLVFQLVSYRAVLQVITQVSTRHGAQLLANQRDFLNQQTEQIDALAENPAWAVELTRLQAAADAGPLPDIDKLALLARLGHLLSGYSGLGGLESIDLFTLGGAHVHLGEAGTGSDRLTDLPDGLTARALASPGRTVWYGIQSPADTAVPSRKVIVSARAIQRLNRSGSGTLPAGLLVMNFSAEYLHDRFSTLDLGAGAYLLLADAQQRLLFHPDARLIGQPLAPALRELLRGPSGSVSLRLKGEDVLLNHLLIPDKPWTMLSIVPQATLTAPMLNIERTGAALLLAGLVAIALFVRMYLRKVVQPIRSVSDGFRDFQADRLDPDWRLAKPNAWVQIGELVGWFNAFLDTMQARRQSDAALHERETNSQSLLRLSRKLELAQTHAEVLNAAHEEVKSTLGYQHLWLYLFTEDKKYGQALMAGGPMSETVLSEAGFATLTVAGDRLLEEIAEARDVVVVEDARTDERTNKEMVARLGSRTIVNVPIIFFDKHLGCVGTGTFGEEGVRVPTKLELEFLAALASHLAVTLDRIHLLTERKQALAELQASEERFRGLTRLSSDWYWEQDAEFRFVRMDGELEMNTGISAADHIGRTRWDMPALNMSASDWEAHQSVLRAHLPFHDLEMRRPDRAGRMHWVSVSGAPIFDAQGNFTGYRGVGADISERKQAQAALYESEERYRTLVEWSPEPMVVDRGGKLVFVNPAAVKMFGGKTAQDLVGKSTFDLIHPDFHQVALARRADITDHGLSTPLIEQRFLKLDGTVIDAETQGTPIVFDGAPAIHVAMRDITVRKQAQAALQSSLREKVALLKEVHHRVKNNLQVITSLLRLEAGRSAVPDTRAVLADMQGRIRSMALLHESLYRSGTFAAVDLGAYLTQLATQAFRTQVTQPGAVRLELDLASVQVGMDQAAPCGLLVNELITNGLKHGFPDGRGGEVRVELHAVDGGARVRLRVSDTGVGLPADFEARRDHSLGLQLVQDLAGQIGGTLGIGPAPTAVFTITFAADLPKPPAPTNPVVPPCP